MLSPSDGAPLVRAEAEGVGRLHRTLGTLDIVLLNIAAIISFRWLSVAAQIGPASLTLWLVFYFRGVRGRANL